MSAAGELGASYVAQVAREEAEKAPPPEAAPAPGAPAAAPAGAAFDLGAPEVAALAWEILDVVVCRFAGADMRLSAEEKARLVLPTVKVLEKHLGAVKLSPEYALAATAGTIYAAKLLQAGALDFGTPKPAESSPAPAPTTTPAAVDGKPVAAEVHQKEASA